MLEMNCSHTHIAVVNLSAFDLNLLTVFDAVMRERSVTRAGASIGLLQPGPCAMRFFDENGYVVVPAMSCSCARPTR